jgi:cephalosporin hydroxylase
MFDSPAMRYRKQELGRRLRTLTNGVSSEFLGQLIQHTDNFGNVTWLGRPVWQNVFDLWTIQETIFAIKPTLLIECGTNRGGSAFFYATLFDLMGQGRIVTIDVEKLHEISHPRVTWLIGSSTSDEIADRVREERAKEDGPIMVILDSDHSRDHVALELEIYAPMVTPGSYLLCQDGVIDLEPAFAVGRPGPLPAIEAFLARHDEFEVDREKCERFLISHHPRGWLRRK